MYETTYHRPASIDEAAEQRPAGIRIRARGPGGAEGPGAQRDLGNAQSGPAEQPVSHALIPLPGGPSSFSRRVGRRPPKPSKLGSYFRLH